MYTENSCWWLFHLRWYTLYPQKCPAFLLSMSSPNVNGFSKFFHWHILWTISNKLIIEYFTTLNCVATLLCGIQMYEKLTIIGSKCVDKWIDTSDQKKCRKWSVQSYAVLDLFLWISGLLNDVIVSDLSALVGLPVYPQWSHSLQYVYVSFCQSHAFDRTSCFPNLCH